MAKYKIAVSKNQKKYTIVFEAETENIARDRVHKEWYSILSIEKIDNLDFKWSEFYFEALKDWKIKKWKVIWNDIFKIYLKLKEGLWYDIKNLYSSSDKNSSDDLKKKMLNDLNDQYLIYRKLNKTKKNTTKKEYIKEDVNLDNFYLKKELDETYKLIDFVLLKLNNVIEKDSIKNLNPERKQKVKNIYNSIIKIRNSTNIAKLKEIWEAALLRIWSLELENLEKNHSETSKVLLKSTNILLKQFGSNKQFVEKSKDYNYILWIYIDEIKKYFKSFKRENKKKWFSKEEKTSNAYFKTLLLIKKYKEKKKENTIEIYKNFYIFLFPFSKNIDKKEEILIKRKVISQNIMLLNAKIHWTVYSYTKIAKGYYNTINNIFYFFITIRTYLFYTILFYSLLFMILLNLSYYNIMPDVSNALNYDGIFYFLIFIFTYFAIYFSRWLITISINFVILSFLIIFWVVNF